MGRFTLCRELGAGGMATVYLSKMRLAAGIERLVALKTIHGHLAKEQTFIHMFLDEAKIASHISHPNVCSVYDFGDVGGVYYMAMEYLVGEPLFDLVNAIAAQDVDELRKVLPFLAARIVADACEGLHAAHSLRSQDGRPLDVVHRDVSPQNLFVTYDGTVKVVDFGCAKALERVTHTNTGVMKGKVSYAAPEQLQHDEAIDARADIWALGVCLWECLTLSQLFRRENAIKTAMAVIEGDIPRADEGRDWVPQALADVAEKALQRKREHRYGDAREMGKALREFIARSGVPFESAEVAEWMQYLFSDRRDRARQIVSEVEKMDVSRIGLVVRAVGGDGGSDPEDEQALADAPTRLARTVPKTRQVVSIPEEDVEDPVVLPTRTGRWWWTALLVGTLGVGGAYAAWRSTEAAPAETRALWSSSGGAGEAAGHAAVDDRAEEDRAVDDRAEEDRAGDDRAEEDRATMGSRATVPLPAGEPAPQDPGSNDPSASAQRVDRRAGESGSSDAVTSRGGERTGTSGARPRNVGSQALAPMAAGREASRIDREPVRPSATLDFSRGPVLVRTTGGSASVRHHGRHLGTTPLRVELPVGTQRLQLVPSSGGSTRTVSVQVEWGALTTVDVDLSPPSRRGMIGDNPY